MGIILVSEYSMSVPPESKPFCVFFLWFFNCFKTDLHEIKLSSDSLVTFAKTTQISKRICFGVGRGGNYLWNKTYTFLLDPNVKSGSWKNIIEFPMIWLKVIIFLPKLFFIYFFSYRTSHYYQIPYATVIIGEATTNENPIMHFVQANKIVSTWCVFENISC